MGKRESLLKLLSRLGFSPGRLGRLFHEGLERRSYSALELYTLCKPHFGVSSKLRYPLIHRRYLIHVLGKSPGTKRILPRVREGTNDRNLAILVQLERKQVSLVAQKYGRSFGSELRCFE